MMGNGENMVMPVSPMLGNNAGVGGWGDNGAWWLLILLFAMGGWGNGYGGFGGGFANEAMWPYFYNTQTQNDVNRGFDNANVISQLTGIQGAVTGGFSDTALGIAGVNQAICNGFGQAEIAANSRQMANMNQAFNAQTAMMQGFNDLQSQFASCCCENRLANCQTQNVIQSESAATRFSDANNTRDIIENQNRNNQTVLDKLCQLELDAKNDKISDLQNQLTLAQLAANNNLQTQTLLTDNLAQTNALERYLAPTPIPAYVVQNPNCCQQYGSCGCGM